MEAKDINLQFWDDLKVFRDDNEHVSKLVFTKKDAVAETVLYRYPTYDERTVICHSVMSGCPMGCRFCGTGDYFVRNLTAEEMLEQVYTAMAFTNLGPAGIHRIKKLQIMSMSMGEPMMNVALDRVYRELYDLYPNASLLMSTSGPDVDYTWFLELAVDVATVGMQFSVHESTDEARDILIPFKKKLSLREMALTGNAFFFETGRKPFFNYCAGEKNSTVTDAMRLSKLFSPEVWEATVSVICEQNDGMPTTNEAHKRASLQTSPGCSWTSGTTFGCSTLPVRTRSVEGAGSYGSCRTG